MAHAEPEPIDEQQLVKANGHLDVKDPATRMEAAISMRVHGATYQEIANFLGYATVSAARQAVERGLASSTTDEDKKRRRTLESRRIERLIRSVMRRATDDTDEQHLGYARTALALIDRHVRLWGLDAPQEMVLYNPTAMEIEEWVAKQRGELKDHLPEEADIMDAEVVESDLGDDE